MNKSKWIRLGTYYFGQHSAYGSLVSSQPSQNAYSYRHAKMEKKKIQRGCFENRLIAMVLVAKFLRDNKI